MNDIVGVYSCKLSKFLTTKINKHVKYEGREKRKLDIGMEIMVKNISKLIILMALAFIFGVFLEFIVVFLVFKQLRKYAYGIHAKTSTGCLIGSAIIMIGTILIIQHVSINNKLVIIIGSLCAIAFMRYAPSDTNANPIDDPKKRLALKKKAVVSVVLVSLVGLIIPYENYKLCVVYGMIVETVTILPITYILLKQRRTRND